MSEPKEPTERVEDKMLCVSAYRLDRHFLGAETPAERAQTLQHVEGCAHCKGELVQLQRHAAHAEVFLDQHAPRSIFDFFGGWGPLALGFCMLLVAVVGWRLVEQTRLAGRQGGYSVIRGEAPHLRVIRKRGPLIEQVRSGDGFAAGDLLRLVVRWQEGGFVYVVHRSATGEMSPLYPAQKNERSLRLESDKEVELPGSLEVEGPAKGREEIGVCFSRAARPFHQVIEALKKVRQARLERSTNERKDAPCAYLQRFVLFRVEGPR
ncbi:MAG: DUF4384 domain-containing protein [Myxococcales bacterium]|nr:DUF4384 domain-containing protein [Myxococcales bacterium]MCB9643490.1 DUF4384 domain-containing protein [Myxococcales bacterium]